MAAEGKRPRGRRARNSCTEKLLLRVKEYRKLARELPLASVAVSLLDRTIEIRKTKGNKCHRGLLTFRTPLSAPHYRG
jgi:hypothetical protein